MPRKRGGASEFIRSQPSSMTAAQVVAEGAAKGVKFTPNLVYMVRSRKTRGRTAGRAARKPRVAQRGQGIQALIARLEEAEEALRAARSVLQRLASFG